MAAHAAALINTPSCSSPTHSPAHPSTHPPPRPPPPPRPGPTPRATPGAAPPPGWSRAAPPRPAHRSTIPRQVAGGWAGLGLSWNSGAAVEVLVQAAAPSIKHTRQPLLCSTPCSPFPRPPALPLWQVEDRPVVKERVELVQEHRPVEKEFVVGVEWGGLRRGGEEGLVGGGRGKGWGGPGGASHQKRRREMEHFAGLYPTAPPPATRHLGRWRRAPLAPSARWPQARLSTWAPR